MNFLNTSPDDRIIEWRKFRDSIQSFSENQQLAKTLEFWSSCPVVQFYIDFDNPITWPTPWEIIHNGNMCDVGLVICMMHTLINLEKTNWPANRFLISVIKDLEHQSYKTILIIDGSKVLNFETNKISKMDDIRSTCVFLDTIVFKDGKYQSLN